MRKYIGDNAADVHVIHKDEAHIELTGTFPGLKSTASMIALKDVITSQTPERGKVLTLPGIFEEIKYVAVESYEFNHDQDDRTHSIDYSIQFVVMGTGYDVKTKKPVTPTPQPGVSKKPTANQPGAKRPASAPNRTYIMTQNTNTLPSMAKVVYGSPDKWPKIVELNAQYFKTVQASEHNMPTLIFGVGTPLKY